MTDKELPETIWARPVMGHDGPDVAYYDKEPDWVETVEYRRTRPSREAVAISLLRHIMGDNSALCWGADDFNQAELDLLKELTEGLKPVTDGERNDNCNMPTRPRRSIHRPKRMRRALGGELPAGDNDHRARGMH